MAYNEVLELFIFCIMSFLLGFLIGKVIGMKEVQVIDYNGGYKEGFETAKKMFYEDPKNEKEKEEQLRILAVKQMNDAVSEQVTPELLMAYGVDSIALLPKSVRDYYNLTENKTLDEIIKEDMDIDRN
jgi:hypothetical protein